MSESLSFEASLEFSRVIVANERLDETLRRVAEVAVTYLEGCDLAGCTLMRDGRPATPVFTDPEAAAIDAAQYRTDVGPCLDAFRTGKTFRIDDTRHDTRWPEFVRAAVEHGVLSTLSLPLQADGSAIGALNLYSRFTHGFPDDDERPELFAAHASVLLSNAEAYWSAHALTKQLEVALESRGVIEQAKGIIMARDHCSADAAFEQLRVESQQTNVKLHVVASRLVDDTQRAP
jgi:GAF domain-containing protein